MTEVTAIVLDFDGGDMTATCLVSLLRQSRAFARVVAVDNGSKVPLALRLTKSLRDQIELIRLNENCGFTGGINHAMKSVQTPLVAWINNDVTLDPRWLEEVAKVLESASGVSGAQSLILDVDGRVDGAGIEIATGTYQQRFHGMPPAAFTSDGSELTGERARATRPYTAPGLPLGKLSEEIWSVSGTAALFAVDSLRACGKDGAVLHPAFFAYYEDVELGARLRASGLRSLLVGEPLAMHRGSQSRARLGKLALRLSVRNRYFVKRLHPTVGSWVSLLREDVARVTGLLMRGMLGEVATIVTAMIEGLVHPIRWSEEQ